MRMLEWQLYSRTTQILLAPASKLTVMASNELVNAAEACGSVTLA